MLFLKVFDDREQKWELLDDHYESPLPDQYRWRASTRRRYDRR